MGGEHQEHDGECQIVVMGRAQLGDLAIFRIRGAALLQILHHDALVRHDDEEHIGRHDRCGESAQMQQCRAAREDLVIAPGHHDEDHEQQEHQQSGPLAQFGFAHNIVADPADGQGATRDRNALP